jgi:hypothetical protein
MFSCSEIKLGKLLGNCRPLWAWRLLPDTEFLRVALLVVILQALPSAYASQPNLADSDSFGPYTVRNHDIENARKIRAELRNFIWTRWRERRRAYAVLTEFSVVDSGECKTTYYIEPAQEAEWHIQARWKQVATARVVCRGPSAGRHLKNPRHEQHAVATSSTLAGGAGMGHSLACRSRRVSKNGIIANAKTGTGTEPKGGPPACAPLTCAPL